jgi:hypothetical protein
MGPNWKSKGGDLANAFATFMRRRLVHGDEPARAADCATQAGSQNFTCYDRQELEGGTGPLAKAGPDCGDATQYDSGFGAIPNGARKPFGSAERMEHGLIRQ